MSWVLLSSANNKDVFSSHLFDTIHLMLNHSSDLKCRNSFACSWSNFSFPAFMLICVFPLFLVFLTIELTSVQIFCWFNELHLSSPVNLDSFCHHIDVICKLQIFLLFSIYHLDFVCFHCGVRCLPISFWSCAKYLQLV